MIGSTVKSSMRGTISLLESKHVYMSNIFVMQLHIVLTSFKMPLIPLPFLISYHRPRTDTCKTCDALKIQCDAETDERILSRLKAELQLHHRKAERAYQQLREDTALAQSSDDVDTITFDLQQSLPTPTLTVNVVYYKRQLWVYNLGVHNCATEGGHMHMWDESVASRGSQEVSSCVFTYLRENPTSATRLIAYSDSCGGQNRNINMVCFWMYVVASSEFSYTVVDHKFMLSGHSYLPNDRDFGRIEAARRQRATIFVPKVWYTLVENARRKNRFHVQRMERTHFLWSLL